MCGIAAEICWGGGTPDRDAVSAMIQRLHHRGPDDSDTVDDDVCSIAHARLSVIDPSNRARQPMRTPDGRYTLSYNGELYNNSDLRCELETEQYHFRSDCDSETVLAAMASWGPRRAIDRFRGMFAFVLYDRLDRRIYCARDRLGIKPLFYWANGERVILASEIKALLQHPAVPRKPDMLALATHVVEEYLEGGWTHFESIRSLPPGVLFEGSAGGIRLETYYDPVQSLSRERLSKMEGLGLDVLADRFESILTDSVTRHARSDVPLAGACSGGVDSSLVSALTVVQRPKFKGYVASVEGALSEEPKARSVGRHAGFLVREVRLSCEEFLRGWPEAISALDAPQAYPSDAPLLAMARQLRADGNVVMMSGEGADELMAGYPWHQTAWQMSKKSRTNRLRRQISALLGSFSLPSARQAVDWTFARWPAPEPLQSILDFRRSWVLDGGLRATRGPAILEALSFVPRLEDRALHAACLNDMYGHVQSLTQRLDHMSMAASVEARVPYLDDAVVDFALHLPVRARLGRRHGKLLLRKVAARHLPPAIAWGRKEGFPTPLAAYHAPGPLIWSGLCRDLFRWSAAAVARLREATRNAPWLIYQLGSMELWARIFLDHQSPRDLGEALVAAWLDQSDPASHRRADR
jgi:asparagine synthase (glutamine-hydrolysing)